MKTSVGLFDTLEQARTAWQALANAGFPEADLSLIAHSGDGDGNPNELTGDDNATAAGATGGAVVGGALGVLAGLAAFAIPGIGPALAIGPLIGGLVGAGAGALSGGLVGSLVDAGVAEEDAAVYWEGVRRGGALVVVNTHGDAAKTNSAATILQQQGARDVKERGTAWRTEGWQGYRDNAEPYTAAQIHDYLRPDVTAGHGLADGEMRPAEMSGEYVDYMRMDVTGGQRPRETAQPDDLETAHNFEPSDSEERINDADQRNRL